MYGMVHATIESSDPAPTAIAFGTDGSIVGITTIRRSATTPREIVPSMRIPFSDRGITSVWSTPIGYALKIADDLIDVGRVVRPTLGVTSIDADAMPRFPVSGIDDGATDGAPIAEPPTDGVVIVGVALEGPADLAGIRVGDLITAVDDAPVHDSGGLVVAIRSLDPGRTVDLGIRRNGTDLIITVTPTA
jgi:S1-C subfamily serine protease